MSIKIKIEIDFIQIKLKYCDYNQLYFWILVDYKYFDRFNMHQIPFLI